MSRITGNDARGLVEAYQAVYAPQELTEEQVWEEVETWVNSLLEEGYDLSDYTWEEMYESYLSEMGQTRTTGQNSSVFTLPTTPSAGSAGGSGSGGRRGSGSSPSSPGSAKPAPSAAPYKSRFAGARDAAFAKAQNIKGSPVVGSKPAAAGAASAPARPAAAATPARPAAATPAAKPAMGPTGKPLVGGIERRTPTRAEMDTAKSLRTPAATTGTLGAATAAASKPAAFSPTPAAAPASKPAAAPAPTPAAAPAPKPAAAPTLGSKKPGSMVSHFDPFDVIKGHLLDEGYADTEESALAIMANMSEEWRESIIAEGDNYDKNRQRAAKRAAERNAARDRGQTGNVPGVGYVTSRRERETYRDSAGTERHTSGARMPSKDKKDN